MKCAVYNLAINSLTEYPTAWKFQKLLAELSYKAYTSNKMMEDSLLVVQHPSIYTLGRGATPNNLKFDVNGDCLHNVVRVERGGEVTWHGPGQIVAYPIFNLNYHRKDLHWLTNRLEETVIDLLQNYGITGERSDVNTGVWVGKNKISAVGLTASRWITMHGIALNVDCDLDNFKQIIPCGIALPDRGVCSIQSSTKTNNNGRCSFSVESKLNINEVSKRWIESFGRAFNLELMEIENPDINLIKKLEKYPEIDSLKLDKFTT